MTSSLPSGRTSASNSSMPVACAIPAATVRLSPVIMTMRSPCDLSPRMASGVEGFRGSTTENVPTNLPSMATQRLVLGVLGFS